MARKKSRTKKVSRTQLSLNYTVTANQAASAAVHYFDVFKDLSAINRKLFRQGYCLEIESIDVQFDSTAAAAHWVEVQAFAAPNTWPVHNAHVKGKALFHQMNQLVLEDNPSIKPKWHDYKIYLDADMPSGTIASVNGLAYGEWNYSDYVLPQHDVDPVSGQPLPADQTTAHLVGPDNGVPGAWSSVGLVNAYSLSRGTVDYDQPNVPPGMADSFFNLLTDSGSQEPELATIILTENDNPPYDISDYPGGGINLPGIINVSQVQLSPELPSRKLSGFTAPCGMFALLAKTRLADGAAGGSRSINVIVNVRKGKHHGVAATPMGQ